MQIIWSEQQVDSLNDKFKQYVKDILEDSDKTYKPLRAPYCNDGGIVVIYDNIVDAMSNHYLSLNMDYCLNADIHTRYGSLVFEYNADLTSIEGYVTIVVIINNNCEDLLIIATDIWNQVIQ